MLKYHVSSNAPLIRSSFADLHKVEHIIDEFFAIALRCLVKAKAFLALTVEIVIGAQLQLCGCLNKGMAGWLGWVRPDTERTAGHR